VQSRSFASPWSNAGEGIAVTGIDSYLGSSAGRCGVVGVYIAERSRRRRDMKGRDVVREDRRLEPGEPLHRAVDVEIGVR
jgi:hypothetical protein